MRRFSFFATLMATALVACATATTPTTNPSPTPLMTPAATGTATMAITPSPAATASDQPTPTLPPPPTPTAPPTQTAPPTPTPTSTATATPTAEPTPTEQPTPTPSSAATIHLKGACLSMTNQPTGGFDRTLLLDLSFEEQNLDAIQAAISGANNDQPAAGTQPLPGLWQVSLGIARGTKGSDLALTLADATKASGQTESFLAALTDSIGNMDTLTPSHSVGDSCGGF